MIYIYIYIYIHTHIYILNLKILKKIPAIKDALERVV